VMRSEIIVRILVCGAPRKYNLLLAFFSSFLKYSRYSRSSYMTIGSLDFLDRAERTNFLNHPMHSIGILFQCCALNETLANLYFYFLEESRTNGQSSVGTTSLRKHSSHFKQLLT
jgi:hypothetical protein